MFMFLWIILGLLVVAALTIIILYNQLVARRQMSENGWSDIAVQLKRRADLIPRLVDTVKGYVKHEKTLFTEIVNRRNLALAAGDDPTKRGQAEAALTRPVSKIIALAESYPVLKANKNFLDLQNELSDTENKIEMARRFYNGAVREFNIKIQTFPANLLASSFGFKIRDYFEINESDRELPNVEG